MVKNTPANARSPRDTCSVPGLGSAKGCCCMSSSSLAFFNSFTLEEKQNKIPGDNYRLKLSPDKGKGVAISPGSEKPRQKPF